MSDVDHYAEALRLLADARALCGNERARKIEEARAELMFAWWEATEEGDRLDREADA